MAVALTGHAERRTAVRTRGDAVPGGLWARIRPGVQVTVVDVSAMGLRVSTGRRLLPGTSVDLTLESTFGLHRTRARIVRCHVGALATDGPVFFGGLELEVPVAWLAYARACVAGERG